MCVKHIVCLVHFMYVDHNCYITVVILSNFVCSLDPRNIFDFPIKWIKGLGLDIAGDDSHKAYIVDFCDKVLATIKEKIMEALETSSLLIKVMDGLYQEVLWHTHYATFKLQNYFVSRPCITTICIMYVSILQGRRKIVSMIMDYINGPDDRPLALYGYSGCGKTHIMAQTACILKEKYNLQKACILLRFVGTSYHSRCIRMLLKSICEQVCGLVLCFNLQKDKFWSSKY